MSRVMTITELDNRNKEKKRQEQEQFTESIKKDIEAKVSQLTDSYAPYLAQTTTKANDILNIVDHPHREAIANNITARNNMLEYVRGIAGNDPITLALGNNMAVAMCRLANDNHLKEAALEATFNENDQQAKELDNLRDQVNETAKKESYERQRAMKMQIAGKRMPVKQFAENLQRKLDSL